MGTRYPFGNFLFCAVVPIGKKVVKKLGELRENFSKGFTLKDHRKGYINNQATTKATQNQKFWSNFSAGGSAVFREAFSVSKRLRHHRIKSFVNLFKGCAGQGVQNPLKATMLICNTLDWCCGTVVRLMAHPKIRWIKRRLTPSFLIT